MTPTSTSSPQSFRLCFFCLALYPFHCEKFMCLRPSRTSFATSHDMGATYEYHGHFVSFEWQSKQERRRIVMTSWGASISPVTGGLVRSICMNCIPTKSNPRGIKNHLHIFSLMLNVLLVIGMGLLRPRVLEKLQVA